MDVEVLARVGSAAHEGPLRLPTQTAIKARARLRRLPRFQFIFIFRILISQLPS
jgi:hypothetical protein